MKDFPYMGLIKNKKRNRIKTILQTRHTERKEDMDTQKEFSFAETQQQFFEEIRQAIRPILWGKKATKYGLSLAQVYAIHEVAADLNAEKSMYFNAGFAAGRRYEREENGSMTDKELFVSMYQNNEAFRELIDAAKGATPEQIQQAADYLTERKRQYGKERGQHGISDL